MDHGRKGLENRTGTGQKAQPYCNVTTFSKKNCYSEHIFQRLIRIQWERFQSIFYTLEQNYDFFKMKKDVMELLGLNKHKYMQKNACNGVQYVEIFACRLI